MQAEIAVYSEFKAQLAELRERNGAVVFDYADPAGNKAARSHIYKLRQTKSAVDKARKEEKAEALEYGRQVDAQAKEIIGEIESMIEVHQRPLDEIEQREKDRQARHQARLDTMRALAADTNEDLSAGKLRDLLAELESYSLGEHWEEFEIEAGRVKEAGIAALKARIERREKYEAEQVELARLRREQEAREQAERDERIARKAAEDAQAAAERAAAAERDAAARRETELKLQAERAEREKAEAELRAQRAEAEAKARAEREAKEAADREAAAVEKREANKRHVAKVHAEIVGALIAGGISADAADVVVIMLAQRKVPRVRIEY